MGVFHRPVNYPASRTASAASSGQPMARLARCAASAGGRLASQRAAGVVDHRLDGAEALARRLHRASAVVLAVEVGRDRQQAVAGPAQRHQPVERGRVAVDRGDAVAVGQERLRHHPSDAAGGAGQQHHAALVRHARSLQMRSLW
jgi:hypothetical protein